MLGIQTFTLRPTLGVVGGGVGRWRQLTAVENYIYTIAPRVPAQ